jgi:hypothetical protein
VRACLDVGLRPPFTAWPFHGTTVEAVPPPRRHSISCPSPRQGRRIQRDCKKASSILHRLVTTCGELPVSERTRSVRTVVDEASVASKTAPGSPMEGTSGAAELVLLRGRTGDAALGPGCVRASDTSRAAALRARRETRRRRLLQAASRERVVEGPRAPTLRGGGARAVGSSPVSLPDGSGVWQRRSLQPAVPRSHDERCPSGSGWGSSLSWMLARADGGERRRRRKPDGGPLARETSAGDCRSGGTGPRPRTAAHRRCCPCSVRDLVVRRGFGRASRPGPSAATPRKGFGLSVTKPMPARARRAERASARWLHSLAPEAGIGRSRGRARGFLGCRSRRAALGPGRKATGLVRWLPPAQAGELSGRMRAGSRIAVAKATSTRAARPVAGSS